MTTTIVVKVDNKKLFFLVLVSSVTLNTRIKDLYSGVNQISYITIQTLNGQRHLVKQLVWYQKVIKDQVVITDQDHVPTYKFMTLVPKIGNKNEMIIPKWQNQKKTLTLRDQIPLLVMRLDIRVRLKKILS